jgi:hypothetical protein
VEANTKYLVDASATNERASASLEVMQIILAVRVSLHPTASLFLKPRSSVPTQRANPQKVTTQDSKLFDTAASNYFEYLPVSAAHSVRCRRHTRTGQSAVLRPPEACRDHSANFINWHASYFAGFGEK